MATPPEQPVAQQRSSDGSDEEEDSAGAALGLLGDAPRGDHLLGQHPLAAAHRPRGAAGLRCLDPTHGANCTWCASLDQWGVLGLLGLLVQAQALKFAHSQVSCGSALWRGALVPLSWRRRQEERCVALPLPVRVRCAQRTWCSWGTLAGGAF